MHLCVHTSTDTRAAHLRRLFSGVAINCREPPARYVVCLRHPQPGESVTTHHARSRSMRFLRFARREKKGTTRKIITGLRVITHAVQESGGAPGEKNDVRQSRFFFSLFFRPIFFADTFTSSATGLRHERKGERE